MKNEWTALLIWISIIAAIWAPLVIYFATATDEASEKIDQITENSCVVAGGVPILERNPRGMIACVQPDALIWPTE